MCYMVREYGFVFDEINIELCYCILERDNRG